MPESRPSKLQAMWIALLENLP
ncbi:hypothetical protein GWI33_009407, partial [Rhynchophorus ferrugineus]